VQWLCCRSEQHFARKTSRFVCEVCACPRYVWPVRSVFLRHHELFQLRERGALDEGPGRDAAFISQGNSDLEYVELIVQGSAGRNLTIAVCM
jgi:hypothetical protein